MFLIEERREDRCCVHTRTERFPLTRQINKVVFAAPSSFQESGTESVASLAADFRSPRTRLLHLLRVLLARFPGQTTIEHTRHPFLFDRSFLPRPRVIQWFKRNLTRNVYQRSFPLKSERYCEISPSNLHYCDWVETLIPNDALTQLSFVQFE